MWIAQVVTATRDSFWPTNAGDWVGVIVGLMTLFSGTGALLGWYVRQKLNGLGRRLKKVEDMCEAREGSLESIQRRQDAFEYSVSKLSTEIGHVRGSVDSLRDTIGNHFLAGEADARQWIKQLTRIETRLGIISDDTK